VGNRECGINVFNTECGGTKKHPCPDCRFCQWCSDERCQLCLGHGKPCGKKLSLEEQIALYESLNRKKGD
jgi:hypothetical protein